MRNVSALLCLALLLAPHVPGRAQQLPNDPAAVEHALNRLAYGPRPGEIERVRQQGLAAWIDRQLSAAAIDDTAAERRLAELPTAPPEFASQKEARQFARLRIQAFADAKLTRAIHSERQLQEILVDFWFNHFNVFAGKPRTAVFVPQYEHDVIRRHVFGRFRDLLGATAKHPAMLTYLDNAQNGRRGLNENYARELLELHTLGVDGGYTQDDVVNVAKAFTGWTVQRPAGGAQRLSATIFTQPPTFRFAGAIHNRDDKTVLGMKLPAGGGIEDGERVLDLLAAHPATARHVAFKLARRFVADDPPEALVARVAARFQATNGDLREVVRGVITSPEFFAAEVRQAKVKTPLEFVASAVRASGRDISQPRPLLRVLQQLGMPPYMCQPPTGYDDTADTWVTAGALVTRANAAQQLTPRIGAVVGGPDFQKK